MPGRSPGSLRSGPVDPERCDACGFDGSGYDDAALLDALRALGPSWQAPPRRRRRRASPTAGGGGLVGLEYAAHSRDITELHVFGVEQALTGEEPVLRRSSNDVASTPFRSTTTASDPDAVTEAALTRASTRLAQLAGDAGPVPGRAGSRRRRPPRRAPPARARAARFAPSRDDVERGFVRPPVLAVRTHVDAGIASRHAGDVSLVPVRIAGRGKPNRSRSRTVHCGMSFAHRSGDCFGHAIFPPQVVPRTW